jgi:peptide-methionine (S)-S-oxide reductase
MQCRNDDRSIARRSEAGENETPPHEVNAVSECCKRQEAGITQTAAFAAGCFWGVEETFRTLEGVVSTEVGYTGGTTVGPSYEDVCTDRTGHAEAVRIVFDPAKIAYAQLLEIFWANHDPTTLDRQGPDVGTQYRSAVFYHTPAQRAEAEASLARQAQSGRFSRPIVTRIVPAAEFFRAEEHHQQYLLKKGLPSCKAR